MDNTVVFYTTNMGSIPVRRTIIFLLFLLFSSVSIAKKPVAPPAPMARAVLLFDRKTNTVKEELNIHEVMPIASVSKLMTVYVVLESHADLDEVITVTAQKMYSSRVLGPGVKVTRRELINMALIASDNYAAKLLAISHPAGYEMFIAEMNSTAQQLKMLNTMYIEPSGLLPNTSTAWDQHLLNRALTKYTVFSEAAMSKSAETDTHTKKGPWKRFVIYNTSAFAGQYDIKVGKTGFTNPAGWCISMTIKHKDREFDLIVLGSPSKKVRNTLVAEKLKDYMNSITASSVVFQIEEIETYSSPL